MSGCIIFEPPTPTQCSLGRCGGKPDAKNYRDGTLWKCDDCATGRHHECGVDAAGHDGAVECGCACHHNNEGGAS